MRSDLSQPPFWTANRVIPIAGMLMVLAFCLVPSLGSGPTLSLSLIACWRVWQIIKGWRPAPRWVVNISMVAGAIAWWQIFPSKLTLEPAVGLLVVATGLKLLEAHSRRDAIVLIYSGFTLAAAVFLFDQSLWFSICVLFSVLMGLVGLQESTSSGRNSRSINKRVKLAALVIITALPITAAWFVIFPRIAPLWAIPIMADSAKMGMSDTLRPGDISKLGQDASLAFRVQFDGDPPPFDRWYWRGITLGSFDDGTWRQHRYLRNRQYASRTPARLSSDDVASYTVTQAASHRSWLYHLAPSAPIQSEVLRFPDETFQYQRPITADLSLSYQLKNERWSGLQTSQTALKLEREFPSHLNPRASNLMSQLVDPTEPWSTVNNALAWYRSQPFSYTLEPPSISGSDFVDQFLFDTQSGFCEHYAYSFVALMRLAGIPARIVGGYMGGELNPLNNTIVVRELDAHAWAEVWIEGRGWVRVDPTGVVAPERVERGSIDSLEGTSGYLLNSPLSLLRFRNSEWINNLRLQLDAMNYEWQTSIMNYRYEQQATLLKALLGQVTSYRILLLLCLAVLVTASPVVLWITWRRLASLRDPMSRKLRWFDRELRRRGVIRGSGDTLRGASAHISFKDDAERARFEKDLCEFERLYYAKKAP